LGFLGSFVGRADDFRFRLMMSGLRRRLRIRGDSLLVVCGI
jgi:hypothetical protein